MASGKEAQKIIRGAKEGIEKAVPTLAAESVIALAGVAILVVKTGTDVVKNEIEKRKTYIEVPEMYSPVLRWTVDEAKHRLEKEGFSVLIRPAEPDISYRNYSDAEVVSSRPRQKRKVEPGTVIALFYLTPEVIEKSRKLFEEKEERKSIARLKKADKRLEQKEKAIKFIGDATTTIQQGTIELRDNVKTRFRKVIKNSNEDKESNTLIDNVNDT